MPLNDKESKTRKMISKNGIFFKQIKRENKIDEMLRNLNRT